MNTRLTRIRLGLFLVLSIASQSNAADLKPRLQDQSLGISLSGLSFPDTLARDLQSGFDNRIVIRISISSSGKVVDSRHAAVVVKYDLWDEQFAVKTGTADGPINEITVKKVDDVLQYLNHLNLDRLFPIASLQGNQDLLLQAEVSINPIEREKIERVRQWVATNSVPGGAVGATPGGTPVTTQPNDLFNKIFDQYIRGEDVVAPWKTTIMSKSFRVNQLDSTRQPNDSN